MNSARPLSTLLLPIKLTSLLVPVGTIRKEVDEIDEEVNIRGSRAGILVPLLMKASHSYRSFDPEFIELSACGRFARSPDKNGRCDRESAVLCEYAEAITVLA